MFKFEGISVSSDGKVMVKVSRIIMKEDFRESYPSTESFEIPLLEWQAANTKINQAATTLKNVLMVSLDSHQLI